MKVAIIITGVLNNFRETHPNILDRVLSKFEDYDVFVSAWNLNDVDKNDFQQIYKPVIIDNENFTEQTKYVFTNNSKWLKSIPNHTQVDISRNTIAMWYKIARCLNIVQEYSYENNIKYDLIVRLRTDFFYQNFLTEQEINNCLNGLISIGVHCIDNTESNNSLNNGHAGDNFFIFSPQYLNFFKLMYDKFYEIWDKYKCITPENTLYCYLKESYHPFEQTNLRFVRFMGKGDELLSWTIDGMECTINGYTPFMLGIKEDFHINFENYQIITAQQ